MDDHHILYGARSGNCLRAAVALEEAGIAHTIRKIALRQGEHKKPAFLAINPQGLVPALAVVRAGREQTLLTQSNAIMFYAAQRAADINLGGADLDAKARIWERFFFFLTEAIAPSMAGFKLAGEGLTDGTRYFHKSIVANLELADSYVRTNPYMAGESFSLADIAAYTITVAHKDKLDWSRLPNLDEWFKRVAARPAVARAMSAFD
ncbi:glutathione S-transferase family protein [Herbaspirillum huttiense]|uniref:glutathione S-transferase family protein n=1 Tax=Herbaspirillum huttiense TaxID=863372 RepID=UPI0039B05233